MKEIGVSPSIIAERKEFIIALFQDAVAAGKLDEDSLEDDEYNVDVANNDQDSTPRPSDERPAWFRFIEHIWITPREQ